MNPSGEFLRMTQAPDGTVTCAIDAFALAPDPAAFGLALADAVRHGAKAWAQATSCTEEEALESIWWGLKAEREAPTDDPQQIS